MAIVDVDFHYGNGTADILCEMANVPFISLHASTIEAFPYVATRPRHPAQTLIAFAEPPSEDAYLELLARELERLSVDVLVISLGYDPVIGDPHGGWTMSPRFFFRLARLFRETERQLCFVQEGGYALGLLAECSHQLASGLR